MEYIIYKICCNDLNVKYTYVGSTMAYYKRKHCHKHACDNEKVNHRKVYTTINENGGWSNWDMVIIEKKVFETKLDARKRERYWYEELNANMNSIYPQRDQKEYAKEYYDSNKDKIKEYSNEYYESNKEKKQLYHVLNKDKIHEKQKKWREMNKDKLCEKNKSYYESNKDTKKECNQCPCGGQYSYHNKATHEKTKKHQKYINELIEN